MSVLNLAIAIWTAMLLAGVSGLAIYTSIFTQLTESTPLAGKAIYWLGHVLIGCAVLLIVGAILGAGAAVGLRLLG